MADKKNRNSSFPHILLVDDDREATEALVRAFSRKGAAFEFHIAVNSEEALALAEEFEPEAAVVDLELDPTVGPESGLSLISALQDKAPTSRVLVLTGHGDEQLGIQALQKGAASFLQKPADSSHLLALLKDAVSFAMLKRQYLKLSTTPEKLSTVTGLSSRSAAMQPVIEAVAYAAANNQPVLITGETGVGKGVIAQAIHQASSGQRTRPLIRFQPNFIGQDLVASELFGHRKGAFTGATEDRRGLLEEANNGTLFIDEIGELPQETQVLLLTVLQERAFRRLGTNREIISNFRLISATNRTVDELLQKKLLREDFFHRIAHFRIEVPPLRKRLEDIADLTNHFTSALSTREKIPVQGFTPEALCKLQSYAWPGNVRELQAVVEGAAYRADFHKRRFIEAEDFNLGGNNLKLSHTGTSFRERVRNFEQQLIRETLEKHDNNQSKAAESLQMDRNSLRRILSREK